MCVQYLVLLHVLKSSLRAVRMCDVYLVCELDQLIVIGLYKK
jgi:hypothetical protein